MSNFEILVFLPQAPKNLFVFWSSVSFKIGAVTRFFSAIFFFWPAGKYVIHCIRVDQISHVYKVWWLREASQIRQTFIPYVKPARQNSNRSSNFGCNLTSFHSNRNKNRNLKKPTRRKLSMFKNKSLLCVKLVQVKPSREIAQSEGREKTRKCYECNIKQNCHRFSMFRTKTSMVFKTFTG